VTVGIVIACKDGIVIGADRKIVRSRGTRIKSLDDKIFQSSFKDGRNFLICSSGGADFAKRAMQEIDPNKFVEEMDCSSYRDMVEGKIAYLTYSLRQRAIEYDATLLYGTIDLDKKPTIGHITSTGLTETKNEGYFTTGIAAPYAEMVLQDSYSKNMDIQDAKLITAALIDRIGKVDNDVEGVDVILLNSKNKIAKLSWAERQGIEEEPLSFDFTDELDDLRRVIGEWQAVWEEALKEKGKESKGQTKKRT